MCVLTCCLVNISSSASRISFWASSLVFGFLCEFACWQSGHPYIYKARHYVQCCWDSLWMKSELLQLRLQETREKRIQRDNKLNTWSSTWMSGTKPEWILRLRTSMGSLGVSFTEWRVSLVVSCKRLSMRGWTTIFKGLVHWFSCRIFSGSHFRYDGIFCEILLLLKLVLDKFVRLELR